MLNIAICVLVVSCSAVVLSAPAPQSDSNYNDVKVVRFVNDNNGIDNYQFTYELDNGQIFSEAGGLKEVETANNEKVNVIVVTGQYSFVGPDGITYWVNYTADENGFHPVVGTGDGGIKPGQTTGLDPNVLKSLIG